jgi:tripeptidyl-peptidase-1
MKGQLIAAALLALGIGCHAIPTPNTHALHEKRSSLPRFWERGSRVESDAILPVRIGLAQSNLDKAYEYLMDV